MIKVHGSLGKKQDPRIIKTKIIRVTTYMVDHLPSICEVLSSNPSTAKGGKIPVNCKLRLFLNKGFYSARGHSHSHKLFISHRVG
jgi:hypothetical protein